MRQNLKRLTEGARESGRLLDTANLQRALGFRLRMFEQASMRSFARHMEPLELTPSLYSILVLVEDNPECRQADLAQALNMHQPNLVERVSLLVSRGVVARRADPSDGRASVLELTFAGRHFMEKVAAAHAAHEAEMRDWIGEERYVALLELLSIPDGARYAASIEKAVE